MSSKLSIDVLQMILDNVDEADLVAVCQVNKVCCSCSQDILYRNIIVDTDHRFQVCQTLAESTHLARRVRSFAVTALDRSSLYWMAKALQNMTSLRSLTLYFQPSHILDRCNFKLDSFTYHRSYDERLKKFLNSQPTLTHLELLGGPTDDNVTVKFNVSCLPNLTRVTTWFSWLPLIVPGRPVSEVNAFDTLTYENPIDLNFFTRSTTPIRRLAILYCCLHSTPEKLLASIFPSLVHLAINMEIYRCVSSEIVVRAPFSQFPSHSIFMSSFGFNYRTPSGLETCSLSWFHSEPLKSTQNFLKNLPKGHSPQLSKTFLKGHTHYFRLKPPFILSTMPFLMAKNIAAGNNIVGSGLFATRRNVPGVPRISSRRHDQDVRFLLRPALELTTSAHKAPPSFPHHHRHLIVLPDHPARLSRAAAAAAKKRPKRKDVPGEGESALPEC
jgi:hypothetical protein